MLVKRYRNIVTLNGKPQALIRQNSVVTGPSVMPPKRTQFPLQAIMGVICLASEKVHRKPKLFVGPH